MANPPPPPRPPPPKPSPPKPNPPQGRSNPVYSRGFQTGTGGAVTTGNARVSRGGTRGDVINQELKATGGTKIVVDATTGKSYIAPYTPAEAAAKVIGKTPDRTPTPFEQRYNIKQTPTGISGTTPSGQKFAYGSGLELYTNSPTAVLNTNVTGHIGGYNASPRVEAQSYFQTPSQSELAYHVPYSKEYIGQKTMSIYNYEAKEQAFGKGFPSEYQKFYVNQPKVDAMGITQGALNFLAFPFKFANVNNYQAQQQNQKTFLDIIGLGNNKFFKTTETMLDTSTREQYKGEMFVNLGIYAGGSALLYGRPALGLAVGAGITGVQGYQYYQQPTSENLGGLVASAALFGLPFIKPAPAARGAVRVESYAPRIEETFRVTPTGKVGNIGSIEVSPEIKFMAQGENLRVSPSTYARIMETEGNLKLGYKLFYTPSEGITYGGQASFDKLGKPIINIGIGNRYPDYSLIKSFEDVRLGPTKIKGISPGNREISLAHELIHIKTPEPLLIKLPFYDTNRIAYRLSPSEIIAFGLENRYATKGFSISPERINNYFEATKTKLFARSSEDLSFTYPREQILETSFGRKAPFVQYGTMGFIEQGPQYFERGYVRVGKGYQELLTGGNKDILYIKEPSGKLYIRQLNKPYLAEGNVRTVITSKPSELGIDWLSMTSEGKGKFGDYLFREFKGFLESKYSLYTQGNEFLGRGKSVPFEAQKIGFPLEQVATVKEMKTGFFKAGTTEGGAEFFNRAYLRRTIEATQFGQGTKFDIETGRNIKQAFYGESSNKMLQFDVGGYQKEIFSSGFYNERGVKIGGRTSIDIRPTNLEYVYQANYESNLAERGVINQFGEVQLYSKSIQRASLDTLRILKGRSVSAYSFEQERIKPVTLFIESFKEFKQGQQQWLYGQSEKSSLLIDQFKLALGKMTQINEPVKMSIPIPEMREPSINYELGISSELMGRTLPRQYQYSFLGVGNFPRAGAYTPIKSNIDLGIFTPVKIFTPTKTNPYINTDIFTPSKTYIPTRTETPTISELFTPTRTETPTITQTNTELQTQLTTQLIVQTNIPIGNISNPFLPNTPVKQHPFMFNFSFGNIQKRKKSKRKTPRQKYLPSLMAIDLGLFGRPSRILSGLEIRPIRKKYQRLI